MATLTSGKTVKDGVQFFEREIVWLKVGGDFTANKDQVLQDLVEAVQVWYSISVIGEVTSDGVILGCHGPSGQGPTESTFTVVTGLQTAARAIDNFPAAGTVEQVAIKGVTFA